MMTCASTRSVGRVGPSVTLAPGITPAQWRLMRQALVWNQLHIQKVFYHPQRWHSVAPRDHSTGNRLLA